MEKATDVLIKVKSSGLCGTDLKIMKVGTQRTIIVVICAIIPGITSEFGHN